jgi:hypothetical protein
MLRFAGVTSQTGGWHMSDGVQDAAARPKSPLPVTGPVKIFISYAGEDEDIMNAVSHSLERLKGLSNSNIRTIFDKKSLDVGTPVPLLRDISDKLLGSDYLVILYTGALKKSFSWTGTELGIFWGFIRADERDFGISKRQIIAIYFDEKPPVDWGALGLNLDVSSLDLRLPRDQFRFNVVKTIREGNYYTQLINAFLAIGAAADERLPAQLGEQSFSPSQWQEYLAARSNAIKSDIVPDLMAQLHDSFSRRVKITNVEQRLIEFRMPKSFEFSDDAPTLPDDTVLLEHGEAFSLFKVGAADSVMTWGSFKSALQGAAEANWIIASIERSAISAVSPDIARDDEQIIRAPDGGAIYRLIITRRLEFFDGSKLVHMYFIPALRFAFLEKSNTAVTLGYINVAVRYRSVFIDPSSPLGVLDYYRSIEFDQLKSKVRRSIREPLIIEDESHILRLDQRESIAIYYGSSRNAAIMVGGMQEEWIKVRRTLMAAAQLLLKTPVTADQKKIDEVRGEWVAALNDFVDVSDRINSDTLRKAIDNLRTYIFGVAEPDPPAAALPAK